LKVTVTSDEVEIAKDLGEHILFQDGLGKGDAIQKAVGYVDPKNTS
jgi:hypothetical protein